ncbi:MAG: hypothetical protein Q4A74_09265, partial [Cardiobacteriaceae bacterium]|nr:hypothetical protein [Cardiobacteriaceae bacterium]
VEYTDNDKYAEKVDSQTTDSVTDNATPPSSNHAPTDIHIDRSLFIEGQKGGIVGYLRSDDADTNDKHTYTVDDARFEVITNSDGDAVLKLKDDQLVEFNNGKGRFIFLNVTADDQHGGILTKEFTLEVTDDLSYPSVPPLNETLPPNPIGTVDTYGTVKVGEVLSAEVVDPDGVNQDSITYLWKRDDSPINRAINKTYTVQADDIGHDITVSVTYLDNRGQSYTVIKDVDDKNFNRSVFEENFSTYNVNSDYSADGQSFGSWKTVFNGGGHVKVIHTGSKDENGDDNKALELSPAANATDQTRTTSTLVIGPEARDNFEYSGTLTTTAQLRQNDPPNPWETSWIVWGYTDNEHFYYFIPKANGWELGKRDPDYKGGLHDVGGQRFLASGTEASFAPNDVKKFRVIQNGDTMQVIINDKEIVTFTDSDKPYHGGKIGLYTEDATIVADDIHLKEVEPNILPTNYPGTVALSGEAQVGKTLTATVADQDNVTADNISYSWYADKVLIAGANTATLLLTKEMIGKEITVQASYTDNHKVSEGPVSTVSSKVTDAATNSNHTPTDIALSDSHQIGEGKDGAVVGKLTTTDADAGDTHTYKVNDERFEVTSDGKLKLKAGKHIDYATEKSIELTVSSDDGHGGVLDKKFTLTVQDDPNYPTPNTPPSPQPNIAQPILEKGTGGEQGGVNVTPPAEATYLKVAYQQNHNENAIVLVRDNATSAWQVSEDTPLPYGATLNATSGQLKLTPSIIDDNSTVTAFAGIGTHYSENISVQSDPDAGQAPNTPTEAILSLSSGDSTTVEGGKAGYTLILDKPATADVIVKISVTDNNHALEPQTLTINKGSTTLNFDVAVPDDTVFSPNNVLNVEISEVQGAKTDEQNRSLKTLIIENDTPPAPTIAAGHEQGSVVITPQTSTQNLYVHYLDEQTGDPVDITVTRNENGTWQSFDLPDNYVTLDSSSGKLTLGAQAVQDGSTVTAHNSVEYADSPEASINAGNNNGAPRIVEPLQLQHVDEHSPYDTTEHSAIHPMADEQQPLHIHADIDPADYNTLVSMEGEAV